MALNFEDVLYDTTVVVTGLSEIMLGAPLPIDSKLDGRQEDEIYRYISEQTLAGVKPASRGGGSLLLFPAASPVFSVCKEATSPLACIMRAARRQCGWRPVGKPRLAAHSSSGHVQKLRTIITSRGSETGLHFASL
ncbi:uncharacterized protein CLUP02_05645 [Colletotrichum lupini]|uniref:Uncharacterized protein n=1 Tax=Colletotrichum lupini TaxID=145971 RepID=A0A9Q8SN62_9PEZI|nr:uncharacterized protein CLUP02_05645 [Colletotrichum lupini]UQC80163.1 hypothetical protein CLUP02_05645 [Colletotrichum lupini]